MPKDCDGALAQDVTRRLQEQAGGHPLQGHGVFTALTEAIASRQSLFVAGLDPNPEMLRHWASSSNLSGRSLLSQARAWCKAVIEATADHVCAYKPSLGFYQAMGCTGLELLMEVRELLPPDLPLIIDSKHGDLNSASAMASYVFRLG